MKTDELAVLAERYYTLIDQQRIPELLGLFDEDIVYQRGGGLLLRGISQLETFYRRDRVIAGGVHELECIATAGDWIAVRGTASGQLKSGEPFRADFADFHRTRGGKIWRRYTYFMDGSV